MNKNRFSTGFILGLTVLILSIFVSACGGTIEDATPDGQTTTSSVPTEVITSITEPDSSPEPTARPSPTLEPSPTSKPTVAASPTADTDSEEETSLIGETLLEERCTECHSLSRVTNKSKSLEEWRTTVVRMVNKGADLDADEQEVLIKYLAETYP